MGSKYVNVRRLFQLMEEQGINKRELANRARIGLSTVTRIFNHAEHGPGLDVMLRIAEALDVSVHELIVDWR